jgi:MFS family permease
LSELQSSVASDTARLGVAPLQSASLFERWYVLIMMCLVYTLSIADRYVVSTVLDPIRLELQLTDSGVAWLTGAAFGLFYVVLGFPLSWLIDRKNRRNIVAICLVLWSIMTAVCGLARTSWQFFFARVGVTVGEAGGTPGANSLLSDYFPATRRAMALTVFALGAPIGAYVGYNVAGAIADHYGWRAVFFALGIPGVLAGIGVWLTVREPQRGCLDAGDTETPTIVETMRFMWQQRSAVHVMMGTAVCALWGWGLMFWTPTFLQRTYHMSVGEAGDVTKNMHLWGGGIATLVTGFLMARGGMADARRVVWLLGGGIGIATVASGVVYYTRDLALAKAMLWIFIPAIYFYIGPGFGLLNNLAQCRMRAMFCAMVLFLANLGNLVIAPPLIGKLSDSFAAHLQVTNVDSLRLAMLCLVPTGLWATAHLFLAARDILKDQERARGFPF